MANPRPSQELLSVTVVVHVNTELNISISAYVMNLCRVVHIRVNTAFEKILSRVRIPPRET